jgi:DNA-binding MarR family transcriptional regulator
MPNLLPKNIPDPRDFIGFLLWQKSNNWEKYINQQIKSFDITQSEIFLLISLAILTSNDKEVTQIDLVKFTSVSPMSVSKALKILERKELISRNVGTDSRSKSLELTEEGVSILIKSSHLLIQSQNTFFPNQDMTIFSKYLKSLK